MVSSFVASRRVSILARALRAEEGWRREWYSIHKTTVAIRVNLVERVTPGFQMGFREMRADPHL